MINRVVRGAFGPQGQFKSLLLQHPSGKLNTYINTEWLFKLDVKLALIHNQSGERLQWSTHFIFIIKKNPMRSCSGGPQTLTRTWFPFFSVWFEVSTTSSSWAADGKPVRDFKHICLQCWHDSERVNKNRYGHIFFKALLFVSAVLILLISESQGKNISF